MCAVQPAFGGHAQCHAKAVIGHRVHTPSSRDCLRRRDNAHAYVHDLRRVPRVYNVHTRAARDAIGAHECQPYARAVCVC